MSVDIIARAIATAARTAAAGSTTPPSPIVRFTDLPSKVVDASYSAILTSGYASAGAGGGIYAADSLATAALASAHPRACKADAAGRYFRLLPDGRGAIAVDALGAAADGTADDLAVINAARAYATAINARRISFTAGKAYRTSGFIAAGNNLAWDFNGATLKCSAAAIVFGSLNWNANLIANVVDEITGPTATLKVTTTTGFSVGQHVLVRLGHNPWVNNEPRWGQSVKIVSINAGASTITIDATVPEVIPFSAYTYRQGNGTTVAVPAVASNGINRAVYALADGDNVEVNDLVFVGDTPSNQSVEGVLWFQGGRNLRFNNIRGNIDTQGTGDAGTGLIGLLQFCRNAVVSDATLLDNKNGRNQASLGRMFNLSNCVNVHIANPTCRNTQGSMFFAESFCEQVVIDRPTLEITSLWSSGTAAFNAVQASQVTVRDPFIAAVQGKSWTLADDGGADGLVNVTGHVKIRGQLPSGMQVNAGWLLDYDGLACAPTTVTISGTTMTLASGQAGLHAGVEVYGAGIAAGTRITAETGGGVYTVNNSQTVAAGTAATFREYAMVDYRNQRTARVRISMTDASTVYALGGPYSQVVAMASANADLANTDVYLTRGGVAQEISASMQAGHALLVANSDHFANTVAARVPNLTGKGEVVFYRSGGSAAPGAFIGFVATVPTVLRSSFTGAALTHDNNGLTAFSDEYQNEMLLGDRVLSGSKTWDPPNVTSGSSTSTTVTVTGAVLGDRVSSVTLGVSTAGLLVSGTVTAANTVTVVLANLTGSAVDLASTTLVVEVRKR